MSEHVYTDLDIDTLRSDLHHARISLAFLCGLIIGVAMVMRYEKKGTK